MRFQWQLGISSFFKLPSRDDGKALLAVPDRLPDLVIGEIPQSVLESLFRGFVVTRDHVTPAGRALHRGSSP